MGRIEQQAATRGSQYWLQTLVANSPSRLDSAIGLGALEWLSPLVSDDLSEYRDSAFLARLGLSLGKRSLDAFWPSGGPVWDGLARARDGACVLIEAKAHIPEMISSCSAKSPVSIEMIQSAFAQTQAAFDVDPGHDWCDGHYQYANRLAHAYLLNELNGVPTELVFVYFVGDRDMNGPMSRDEWLLAVREAHAHLGVLGQLPRYVRDVFVDIGAG